MTTATMKRARELGPFAAGTRMSPREFDRAYAWEEILDEENVPF